MKIYDSNNKFNSSTDFLTVKNAAKLLSVSTKTIRNYITSNKLPAFKLGGDNSRLIRIDKKDLSKLLRKM